jgi:hypothetical protein
MKKLMILGALIGFSSGLIFGLAQGSPWPAVMWRAALVCFATSYLFRWWGRQWLRSLRQAQMERLLSPELQTPPANL